MRNKMIRLSVAILVVTAAAPAAAQTLRSNASVDFSVTTPNQVVQVNTIVCTETVNGVTRQVEAPIMVQWFDFWKLQGRKGHTAAFNQFGTLAKDILKITGPSIKVQAFAAPAIHAVQFEARYSQDNGKTWKRQVYGGNMRLDCDY